MTPQLQQAIKLLQLSRFELDQFISKEVIENPALEEDYADHLETKEKNRTVSKGAAYPGERFREKYLVNDHNSFFGQSRDVEQEYIPSCVKNIPFVNYENMLSSKKTLAEHLLDQISCYDLSDIEKKTAVLLVGNITEKGYLGVELSDFCERENIEIKMVERLLDLIQGLEPLGVGAKNLEECLLLQLKGLGLCNGIVEKIVANHILDLVKKDYQNISKKLKITVAQALENSAVIAGLEPTPGRQFEIASTQYIVPDAYVYRSEQDGWMVFLNSEGIPKLRISKYYKNLSNKLKNSKEKKYIKERIKAADWLVKSLGQRQQTIYKVVQCILDKQVDFFEHGITKLRPMILKNVALSVGMHESTISRVTSNKYIHTPRGVFELKFFFNSFLEQASGEKISSESVKSLIREVVSKENSLTPHSDQELVHILHDKGITIARRTVAKYREQIGILPSSKRKKFYQD